MFKQLLLPILTSHKNRQQANTKMLVNKLRIRRVFAKGNQTSITTTRTTTIIITRILDNGRQNVYKNDCCILFVI